MHYPAPSAPPEPGQLRAGEHTALGMMTILTSAGATSRRMSIGFFFIPNHDAEIACVEGCSSSGNPAKYEPLTVQEYRVSRFAKTAGDQKAA